MLYDEVQAFLANKTFGICLLIVISAVLISPATTEEENQPAHQKILENITEHSGGLPDTDWSVYDAARRLLLDGDTGIVARSAENLIKTVPYIHTSIPMRIYECLSVYSMLRCTKLFVLQKMEERKQFPNTGNITKDFLDQFFGEEERMGSLITDRYTEMSDKELNQRLVVNFQKFFKHRQIKLHFFPGMLVKIVPSKENKLQFSLKKKLRPLHNDHFTGRAKKSADDDEATKDDASETEGDSKRNPKKKIKNRIQSSFYKNAILQMAVPVMVMPAVLMGSFLPFILPALKMATIMTLLLNNSAFIAALIYAARTHANSQEEQHINYGHPAFH